jgi:exodeoxyribonuclease-3
VQPPFRIVSLNLRHGGGHRIGALIDWLLAQEADIVVLSEWQANGNGRVITTELSAADYGVFGRAKPESRANGVMIAAKEQFTAASVTPDGDRGGELLMARWTNGLTVVGAYFPQLDAKRPFFDRCKKLAKKSAEAPFLLIGDLNTGRNDIDLELDATPFACATDFVELSDSAGLTDLWRKQHGPHARDWSWKSPAKGFRVDHAFANAAFVSQYGKIRCYYDHKPRVNKITDHSAVVVEMQR